MSMDRNTTRERLLDVANAAQSGECITDLAKRWGLTRTGAMKWCRANAGLAYATDLANNGTASIGARLRTFDIAHRLRLIRLCRAADWSWNDIGLAVGCTGPAIVAFAVRHAPDGIDAALEDFREEEAA